MKRKFALFPFDALDYKAAQDYLTHKAKEGWVPQRLILHCFLELVPAQGRESCVELCPYSAFGPSDDLVRLCGDAGWEYVGTTGELALFRSLPGAGTRPLQSDGPLEWRELLRKQVFRRLRFAGLMLLLFLGELAISFPRWSAYSLTLIRTAAAFLPFLLWAGLTLPVLLWQVAHTWRYLARCRAANAVVDQPWRPAYLRSLLSFFLILGLLILWAVVLATAFP